MKKNKPIKIIRKGHVAAMDGNELWVNTQTDERIVIAMKDRDLRWDLYCKCVKITIEQIDESEL